MTTYHKSDFSFQATRPSVVNHLKNGGFFVYRSFTAINFKYAGTTQVYRTQYVHRVTDVIPIPPPSPSPSSAVPVSIPSFMVETSPPKESLLGYWDVWGVSARVVLNEKRKSLDGGNLITVRLMKDGDVSFRQTIESFNKFRGKPVTFSLSGLQETGGIKVVLKLSVGTKTLEGRPFFSERMGSYYRMVSNFDVPLDISKMEVMIVLTGRSGASVSLSGAVLCLGAYYGDLPFSESLADLAIPSGAIIAWTGESCPSGYKSIGEGDYLFPTLGDPNAARGNLYTGATKTGNLDSMGPRGALEVGANSHKHEPVPTDIAKVVYGRAFAPEGETDVVVENNNKQFYDYKVRTDLAPQAPIFSARTDDHRNRFILKQEDIEPPRIRVRLCEKI